MNPIITPIEIDPKKLEQFEKVLANKSRTKSYRKDMIRKYIGNGYCHVCEDIPTIKVCYDVSDSEMSAKRVERYCRSCYVKLTATNGDQTIAIRENRK